MCVGVGRCVVGRYLKHVLLIDKLSSSCIRMWVHELHVLTLRTPDATGSIFIFFCTIGEFWPSISSVERDVKASWDREHIKPYRSARNNYMQLYIPLSRL